MGPAEGVMAEEDRPPPHIKGAAREEDKARVGESRESRALRFGISLPNNHPPKLELLEVSRPEREVMGSVEVKGGGDRGASWTMGSG